jgi:hypothetical protein
VSAAAGAGIASVCRAGNNDRFGEGIRWMYVINRDTNRIEPLQQRTFSELGLRERSNLQEWIANHPVALGEELLVIQKEFAGFADTAERLDLLALDKRGNLVVIENKLDDSGRDVTWQALKYASYCSSLTKEQIRGIFQSYLDQHSPGVSAADRLAEFFQAEYEELELNPGISQRIVLIAGHFRKEVTSTVLWLMNYKVQVQCIEARVYSLGDELFLRLEQIIPLRGAEEYIIGMAEKTQEDAVRQKEIPERYRVRREFWSYVLERMNRESDLFRNISPGNEAWIGTGSGVGGHRLQHGGHQQGVARGGVHQPGAARKRADLRRPVRPESGVRGGHGRADQLVPQR